MCKLSPFVLAFYLLKRNMFGKKSTDFDKTKLCWLVPFGLGTNRFKGLKNFQNGLGLYFSMDTFFEKIT
jgi:hypothetical protein